MVERSDKLHSTNECIDVDAFAANSTEQSSQASINNEDDNVKIIDEEHNSSQPGNLCAVITRFSRNKKLQKNGLFLSRVLILTYFIRIKFCSIK